ncbi:MAG: reverse transcriptase domain-containing protein [Sweet potato little leaf phytoplasma]|nr:reverse transcriptase domain-containing protein [Sweet potato little leaf phytoplasma]
MTTRAKSGIFKPKLPFSGLTQSLTSPHMTPHAPYLEPQTFIDVVGIPAWKTAMDVEFAAFQHNNTWDLVPPHSSQHLIGTKWIYKIKRDVDSNISRYKARLVAKGYLQQPGIDYGETFSPVIKSSSIRVVLTLAIAWKWELRQLDVSNAFLHGTITEDVYLAQPQGYIDPRFPHHVCKLKKGSLWP